MFDAAMFYLNRIRTENKGDKLHADWVTAWCEIFNSLQKYIRQFHTTGLIWNSSPVLRNYAYMNHIIMLI